MTLLNFIKQVGNDDYFAMTIIPFFIHSAIGYLFWLSAKRYIQTKSATFALIVNIVYGMIAGLGSIAMTALAATLECKAFVIRRMPRRTDHSSSKYPGNPFFCGGVSLMSSGVTIPRLRQ